MTAPRQRLARRTTTLANGTSVTKTKLVAAGPLEWECQAAIVRAVRQIPGYGDEAGPDVTFTFAADFNAGRRSMNESVKAKATGIKAGEEDLRFIAIGERTLLVELKGPKTPVSADQVKRHALHRHLGFRVEVVRCKTIEQGVADVVAMVSDWLSECRHTGTPPAASLQPRATVAANDNNRAQMAALGRKAK